MTITVSRYSQPQVELRPLTQQRLDEGVSPAAFGAAGGAALSQVAQVIERVQIDAEHKQVQEAETALKTYENGLLFDPEKGAFSKRGKNAFGLPGQILPQYETEARRLEGTLRSGRAKAAFRVIARERGGLVARDLDRHESEEQQRYSDEQDQASIAASQQAAGSFAGDDERVARELVQQRDTVAGIAERKGWSPEKAALEMRIAETGTHSAVVGSLIARQQFTRASEYLARNSPTMLDNEVESLQRRLLVEEDRAERRREREERDGQNEASKDGDRLLAEGQLSPAWIEQNRSRLSASDYRYFYGKLTGEGEGGPRDKMVYADLRERAGAGQDVRNEAREALQRGSIQASDYDRIIGEVEQQRPSWYKRGSSFISTSAAVSDLNPDPAAAQRKASMLDDWAEWAEENPKATATEAEVQAKRIVREYGLIDLQKFTLTKRLPRYLIGSRETPDLDATARATIIARAKGEIDEAEFQRQALLIQEWRRALAAGQEKEIANPNPKRR